MGHSPVQQALRVTSLVPSLRLGHLRPLRLTMSQHPRLTAMLSHPLMAKARRLNNSILHAHGSAVHLQLNLPPTLLNLRRHGQHAHTATAGNCCAASGSAVIAASTRLALAPLPARCSHTLQSMTPVTLPSPHSQQGLLLPLDFQWRT